MVYKLKKSIIHRLTIKSVKNIRQAMKLFEKNQIGTLFVVDTKFNLLGSVTDGDIRRALLKGRSLDLNVRIVMNPNPYKLYSEQLKKNTFIDWTYDYIPVISANNKLIDILSKSSKMSFPNKGKKNLVDSKKILIIGGAGYIGSVLVRELLMKGYRVRILDSMLYGDSSVKELFNYPNFEYIIGDSRNNDSVKKAIDGISTVVHFGEIVGDPACALDDEYTLNVNLSGTENILKISRDFDIKKFIYASSCSVYGFGSQVFNEKSITNPLSLYAKTKLQCEKVILSYYNSDFVSYILRFATAFGWSYRPRFDLVLNVLCLNAYFDKKVTIFGGEQWRPFIHVRDIAKVISKIIKKNQKEVKSNIYNVGSNDLNIKLVQLGNIIKGLYSEVELKIVSESVDNRSYKVDFTKLRNEINFKPKYNFQQGIKEVISQLKKSGVDKNILLTANNMYLLNHNLQHE